MIDVGFKTVLLSPVGGQAMYGIAKYFVKNGVKVIGIDRNPEAVGKYFVDTFFAVPDVSDKGYMDYVLKIIIKNKVNIFISWLDPEIIFWNGKFNANQIPSNLIDIYAFNFRSDIMNFYDKLKFYSILAASGFCFPKTSVLSEYYKDIANISFPVVIKPRIGTGARNVYIIDKPQSLKYHLSVVQDRRENIENFLIQEYIPGFEYTVDFFAVEGSLINLVNRKRIEHRGVSLKGEIVYNDDIERTINRFASQFKIDGLNNIQVIESERGIFITDFNPRPSGTIMLSINAGVDFLTNLLEQRCGKEITQYGRPKRLKMIRYLAELYYE